MQWWRPPTCSSMAWLAGDKEHREAPHKSTPTVAVWLKIGVARCPFVPHPPGPTNSVNYLVTVQQLAWQDGHSRQPPVPLAGPKSASDPAHLVNKVQAWYGVPRFRPYRGDS